ncbi:MAG: LPS export ABC transporter periplasmic protein LptC, partial [Pseudomonadota bacterium]
MIKRIMIYSGLIMLIGISVWMLYHNQSSTKGLKIQPNTIIYNIHAKNFDKTGALASQFYTPKLTHYNKDNESR